MADNQESPSKPYSMYSLVLLAAFLFAFIQAFSLLSPILLSFLLIFLISFAVNPIVLRLRALIGGRKGATGVIVATIFISIGLIGWIFSGPLKDSITNLSQRLPVYWERFQKPLIKMEQQAILSERKLQSEVSSEIAKDAKEAGEPGIARQINKQAPIKTETAASLRANLGQMLRGMLGHFTSVAFNATQFVIVLVTVFLGVSFTLADPRPIFATFFTVVPERHHRQTLIILRRIGNFIPSWAGATLLGMLAVGLLVALLMWPILGFTDAMVLGLIAGIFEAIPFLGPLLSALAALLLAIGKGGMAPLWVAIAYLAVQTLEGNVIIPFIMAHSMKVHPVAVIFSMLLCIAAFGVLGVLVAAPLVVIVGIIHDELYRKRFLPNVTDDDLDRLARQSLGEKKN